MQQQQSVDLAWRPVGQAPGQAHFLRLTLEHPPAATRKPRADEALPLEPSQEGLAGGGGDAETTEDHAGRDEGMFGGELSDVC